MLKPLCLFCSVCISTCNAFAQDVRVHAPTELQNLFASLVKQYQQQQPDANIVRDFNDSESGKLLTDSNADIVVSTNQSVLKSLKPQKALNLNRPKYLMSDQLVAVTSSSKDIPFGPVSAFNFAQAFKGNLCIADANTSRLGHYTKQSLNDLGWLSNLEQRTVRYQNSLVLINAIQNQSCDVGIVFQSTALSAKQVKIAGIFPAKTHDPIRYYSYLTPQGARNKDAEQFQRFILSNSHVRSILTSYGFTVKK